MLRGASAGEGSVLVLRGEAGIGKSALLDYVAERATGCRLARAAGVESEMELPMAGVQQLLGPAILERSESLPAPQRDALSRAFGLTNGPAPDVFLVGLALLGIVADVAHEQPLICLIDDEQWLDRASAQVLAFIARRLEAESVGIVFAARAPTVELDGLPATVVEGLGDMEARALLDSVLAGPIDERIRDQIISETRGNPLALLELPRAMSLAELAGGFGLPGAGTLSGRIEATFRRQLAALGDDTVRLLRLAAADPTGERLLVWRAAGRLGISAQAAIPAVESGLVEFGMRVRFRHPLIRSVAYRSASLAERQELHRALAEATDAELDPDRRAWHRGQAVQAPDEDVARELEGSADRARARGGIAAGGAFLARAVVLTPDPRERGRRAVAAAEAEMSSGSPHEALGLLSVAEQSPLDEALRVQVDLVRAFVAFSVNRGSDAPPLLLAAAKRLEPLSATRARDTYLAALRAAFYAGRFNEGGVGAVARAARAAPPAPDPPRGADLLLDGLALTMTDGYTAGAAVLKRALAAFADPGVSVGDLLEWGDLACQAAFLLWDDRWGTISERMLEASRAAGAGSALPLALTFACGWRTACGELDVAAALVHELEVVAEATRTSQPALGAAALAAWRGNETTAVALLQGMRDDAAARGEGLVLTFVDWTSAVLYNGLGKYEQALEAASVAYEHSEEEKWSPLLIHELVEAAVRGGERERAVRVLGRLAEMAAVVGTDKALGLEARSRALVSEGEEAERLHVEAIDRLSRTAARVEVARAHLLYGEWLRREGRRTEGREQLRRAHEMLVRMGVGAFAERARIELEATGEKVRKRAAETRDELTAQERQIAQLARDHLTNQEIGSQLFLSHRTVEWHLRKVFMKLGIASRRQLAEALRRVESELNPA